MRMGEAARALGRIGSASAREALWGALALEGYEAVREELKLALSI
jgi:hypothetical protein